MLYSHKKLSCLTVEDAVAYLKKKEKFERNHEQSVEMLQRTINPEDDILTIDDAILAQKNLPLQQYDAFILFDDNDIQFATKMIGKIESFGMKVNRKNICIITAPKL